MAAGLIIVLFCIPGWSFARASIPDANVFLRLSVSPVFGVAIFAFLSIAIKICLSPDYILLSDLFFLTVTSYLTIAFFCFVRSIFRLGLPKLEVVSISFLTILCVVADAVLFNTHSVLMTGDSWKMIDPAWGYANSLYFGYPIMFQSAQSIATLGGHDYFFPGLNLLLGISLSCFMVCAPLTTRNFNKNISSIQILCLFLAPGLLFTSWHGFLQLGYQNHHMFAAIGSLLMLVSGNQEADLSERTKWVFWIGGVFVLCVSRLEGVLVAYCILFSLVSCGDPSNRRFMPFTYATTVIGIFFSFLYFGTLSAPDNSIMLIFCLAVFFSNFERLIWQFQFKSLQKFESNPYTALLFCTTLSIGSLADVVTFAMNAIATSTWGGLTYYLLFASIWIFLCSYILNFERTLDDFFVTFATLVGLILGIIAFRGWPVISDWSNSSNRMLFQLCQYGWCSA